MRNSHLSKEIKKTKKLFLRIIQNVEFNKMEIRLFQNQIRRLIKIMNLKCLKNLISQIPNINIFNNQFKFICLQILNLLHLNI
jgi:hypothetical protein